MFIALPLVALLFVAFFLVTQHNGPSDQNASERQHDFKSRELDHTSLTGDQIGAKNKNEEEEKKLKVNDKMKEEVKEKREKPELRLLQDSEFIAKPDAVNTLLGGTVLLIICANRPDYLKKTLSYVVKYHPKSSVSIVVSEDGKSSAVGEVIQKAKEEWESQLLQPSKSGCHITFKHVHHLDQGNIRYENGYFKLSAHFKWALNEVFQTIEHKRVIILEEDLQIAPDFFEYFAAVTQLVDSDPTVLAASAWNDNGLNSLVKDEKQLYRSDFFPGLGWMMSRKMWQELGPKWPRAYWDDWLREPPQRKNRVTIRPEVCRTFHFGAHGVSNAQYSNYLDAIELNKNYVPFTTLDLQYLQNPQQWDHFYLDSVREATLVTENNFKKVCDDLVKQGNPEGTSLKIAYGNFDGFGPQSLPRVAKLVGAMDNVKAGVPRTAYHGVVSVWYKALVKIHLIPRNFV